MASILEWFLLKGCYDSMCMVSTVWSVNDTLSGNLRQPPPRFPAGFRQVSGRFLVIQTGRGDFWHVSGQSVIDGPHGIQRLKLCLRSKIINLDYRLDSLDRMDSLILDRQYNG